KAPTLRPLVAAGLQSVAQLLPGTDRVRCEFFARERAYAGGRTGDEADGSAQHHGGRSHLAPGSAPLMITIRTKKMLHIIIGAWQLGNGITMKQAGPVALADLQKVLYRGCEGPGFGLMLPHGPKQPVQPSL